MNTPEDGLNQDIQRDINTSNPVQRPAYPLLILQLAGSQEDMGRQHGGLLRAAGGWEDALDYYPRMPEHILSGALPGWLVKTGGRAALGSLVEALERDRDPELRARNRAFMQALGRPARWSRYTLVMDVLQNVVGLNGKLGATQQAQRLSQAVVPGCSTLAAWGSATRDGRLLHGRNFDFPGVGVWERQPALVFCSPDKGLRYGFATVRGGDVPGVSTFNEAGICVTTHTRFHQDVTLRGAGVIDLIHQITRHATSLQDAVDIVRRRPVASSWGLFVSSAQERRAVVIETAGRLAHLVEPQDQQDFLPCTNRYRHPAMQQREVTLSAAFIANSDGREAALIRTGQRGDIDVATLQAMLGSHAEAIQPQRERGAGSVVAQPTSVQSVVFDPEHQTTHLSVGPCPSGGGPWVAVPWTWDGAPSLTTRHADPAPSVAPGRFERPGAYEARAAYIEAVGIENRGGSHAQAAQRMELAARLDPKEPTWRFLAAALAVKSGDLPRAAQHLDAGLQQDQAPFYRGQSLLLASRVAHLQNDLPKATHLRAQLLALDEPLLRDYHQAARQDERQPPTLARLRKLPVRLHLVDMDL